ncbi:MAG: 3-methyl-2-oxobutanoate hydroxymethyltransferase [Phototrophicales bacterium]|nr:MAG: 3-methyl-2-oxobutanoate hydroxymethyltransferase [Phototrophicales bacterium]
MDKISLDTLQRMKKRQQPITMVTAYDYPTARLVDDAEVEIALVGDSLGMVVHGFSSTLPVTMDMMILHTQAVRRGLKRALLVADMPFMSYQTTPEDALRNAARFLQEGGADAIKIEGGQTMATTIRRIVDAGIAVMGHVGLTPQSISAFGGFRVQGKTIETARKIIADAKAVEAAGAFSIVIEGVPAPLAAEITKRVSIPTIGIGAGAGCDGQVLVIHDILGLYSEYAPKFVKQYARLDQAIREAIVAFREDVRARQFPTDEHVYNIKPEVWDEIIKSLDAEDWRD